MNYKSQNNIETRNTINRNLRLIKPNTTLSFNYCVYREIKLFNNLPYNIKTIQNKSRFKYEIKKMYIQF